MSLHRHGLIADESGETCALAQIQAYAGRTGTTAFVLGPARAVLLQSHERARLRRPILTTPIRETQSSARPSRDDRSHPARAVSPLAHMGLDASADDGKGPRTRQRNCPCARLTHAACVTNQLDRLRAARRRSVHVLAGCLRPRGGPGSEQAADDARPRHFPPTSRSSASPPRRHACVRE